MSDFLSDIDTLRQRARQHLERGSVTDGYKADRKKVIAVLNEALATEIVCVLRYKRHYYMASGIHAEPVAKEFLQHAKEEQITRRPDRPAHHAASGRAEFQSGGTRRLAAIRNTSREARFVEMIREDLVAERIAVESYSEIIRWLGNDDPTTRNLIEDILKKEEEHADDLSNMLKTFMPEKLPAHVKTAQV